MRAFAAMIVALAMCLACVAYLYHDNQRLAADVVELQETVDAMARESAIAQDMAAKAMRERAKQYEANVEMLMETERVLQGSGDFCGQLLPDDVRRLLRGQGTAAAAGTTGGTVPGDGNPQP